MGNIITTAVVCWMGWHNVLPPPFHLISPATSIRWIACRINLQIDGDIQALSSFLSCCNSSASYGMYVELSHCKTQGRFGRKLENLYNVILASDLLSNSFAMTAQPAWRSLLVLIHIASQSRWA